MIRLLGFVFLAIGALGLLLPLLPTTPFILLAAGCFAQSSERMHRWILANRTFGPMVRDWNERRCIRCRVKWIAIASMGLVGGFSLIVAIESATLRIIGGLLLASGAAVVAGLQTCRVAEKEKAG
ncbi:MAG: YbaN family protein [Xanthomonadales bacterium]